MNALDGGHDPKVQLWNGLTIRRYHVDDESSIDELWSLVASPNGHQQALSGLKISWPSLVAEHGAAVRKIMQAIPGELWENDPWLVAGYASSYRSLRTPSRSAALPYFAAALAIITDTTPLAVRAAILIRYAATLRCLGRLEEALQTARQASALLAEDPSVPLDWRIGLSARAALQGGLALYHLGEYDKAAIELRVAGGLASTHLFPADQVECYGGIAMLHYSLGDFAEAQRLAGLAREAAAGSELLESAFGAAALIAELLMAVEQERRIEAEALAALVATAAERSDWEPLGFYARAAVTIINDHHVTGLDLLRQCLQSYRTWQPRGAIETVSEGLRATFLLRLGETETAWDILGSLSPTQHHANCPARFIAHLRFMSGDARGTLLALRDCEAIGDAHSNRTLVDVLLLKAAANNQLGMRTIADVATDRALLLASHNGMRLPFRLVPNSVMRELLDRATTRTQSSPVHALLGDVRGSSGLIGGSDETLLSTREREVVRALIRDLTVSEIADELYISVNTVKSHLKKIYRKFGVSSRAEAIKRARQLGFQLEITH